LITPTTTSFDPQVILHFLMNKYLIPFLSLIDTIMLSQKNSFNSNNRKSVKIHLKQLRYDLIGYLAEFTKYCYMTPVWTIINCEGCVALIGDQ